MRYVKSLQWRYSIKLSENLAIQKHISKPTINQKA